MFLFSLLGGRAAGKEGTSDSEHGRVQDILSLSRSSVLLRARVYLCACAFLLVGVRMRTSQCVCVRVGLLASGCVWFLSAQCRDEVSHVFDKCFMLQTSLENPRK